MYWRCTLMMVEAILLRSTIVDGPSLIVAGQRDQILNFLTSNRWGTIICVWGIIKSLLCYLVTLSLSCYYLYPYIYPCGMWYVLKLYLWSYLKNITCELFFSECASTRSKPGLQCVHGSSEIVHLSINTYGVHRCQEKNNSHNLNIIKKGGVMKNIFDCSMYYTWHWSETEFFQVRNISSSVSCLMVYLRS